MAQGFSQNNGVYYDEIYQPVAIFSSFRFMIELSEERGYEMIQLDVNSPLLNWELEEMVI